MTHFANPPPSIDTVADVLPSIVRGMAEISRSLDVLVEITLQATNLPEETAEALIDLGDSLSKQGDRLMAAAIERRSSGPGSILLLKGPGHAVKERRSRP